MKYTLRKQAGDTLVEVLLATVIMSVVIASAYTLANRATRINQAGFERTEVTNLLQAQAEYLRGLRTSDKTAWDGIWTPAKIKSGASGFNCTTITDFSSSFPAPTGSFSIDPGTGLPQNSIIENRFYKIWIRAREVVPNKVTDFSINACWPGLGSDTNNFAGIVLRLSKDGS